MSLCWVEAPYRFRGQTFGSLADTTPGKERYCYELFLVDEHGQPLCSVLQNERSETYDIRSIGQLSRNLRALKNGGCFKKLADALLWCTNNDDWSSEMPEKTTTNGVPQQQAWPEKERQHCPACSTDGEHELFRSESGGLVLRNGIATYRCGTCNSLHARFVVQKTAPTIETNAALVAKSKANDAQPPPDQNPVAALVRELDAAKLDRKQQPLHEIERAAHYNTGKIEVIDAIEDWQLNFSLGNAVKYIARSAHKSATVNDLKKARWYLTREIERLEAELQAPDVGAAE